MKVRCFFDSGIQRSFIHKNLANQLGLKGVAKVDMILNTFDNAGKSTDYETVNPLVSLRNRKKRVITAVVNDMPKQIVTPGLCETMRELDRRGYPLADKDIDSDLVDNIQILIGSDFLGRYLSGRKSINNIDLPESPGGYLVYGIIPHGSDTPIHCNSAESGEIAPLLTEPHTVSSCVVYETLLVHKFWDLDVVGINPSQVSPRDAESVYQYESTVKHCDGRY